MKEVKMESIKLLFFKGQDGDVGQMFTTEQVFNEENRGMQNEGILIFSRSLISDENLYF